jgi:signal peptidase II
MLVKQGINCYNQKKQEVTLNMLKRHKVKFFCLLIISTIILLDQYTKYLIHINLRPYQVKFIIKGFFNLVYAQNTGSAFSLLANAAPWFRVPFFLIVPSVAMIIMIILMKKSSDKQILEKYAFATILGGAFGNFLDRIHYGYVIDFLQLHYRRFYWPSFNVADIAITVGVVLLFIGMTISDRRKKRLNKNDTGKRI